MIFEGLVGFGCRSVEYEAKNQEPREEWPPYSTTADGDKFATFHGLTSRGQGLYPTI